MCLTVKVCKFYITILFQVFFPIFFTWARYVFHWKQKYNDTKTKMPVNYSTDF